MTTISSNQPNPMSAETIRSVLLGHAVADALGVPVEFLSRPLLVSDPVTDMRAYGTHNQPAGTWSDDTSMSLCAFDVLLRGYCDMDEIMENFRAWFVAADFTATDRVFDIGMTCRMAIGRYHDKSIAAAQCGSVDENANGNGSLMRIHPFVLYLLARDGKLTPAGIDLLCDASALTHAHRRSKLGCIIYAYVLAAILAARGNNSLPEAVARGLAEAEGHFGRDPEWEAYSRLVHSDFAALPADAIRSSGYVVHTLEAAIWCLLTTDNYRDCVLKAVNLGNDTDTVGAVAGGLAGAYYGTEGIPAVWLETLARRAYIEEMCDRAAATWSSCFSYTGITDLHMHIVPGMDDGARDMNMAVEMLRMAYRDGVRRIFCTSHSRTGRMARGRYEAKFAALCTAAASMYPDMTLQEGCEILCSGISANHLLAHLADGDFRTLGESRYVLLEFDTQEPAFGIRSTVELVREAGYLPIIAHAERYRAFDGEELAAWLIESGALIQVNAYSLAEETNRAIKHRAQTLLARRQIHLLGSDAHRLDHRPPHISEGARYILAHADRDYADRLLRGENLTL